MSAPEKSQSNSGGKRRTLVWQPEFQAACDACGHDGLVQRAVNGLCNAISQGAEFFDETPDFPGKRLAKSDDAILPGFTIRIWFEIADDDDRVYLYFLDVDKH